MQDVEKVINSKFKFYLNHVENASHFMRIILDENTKQLEDLRTEIGALLMSNRLIFQKLVAKVSNNAKIIAKSQLIH